MFSYIYEGGSYSALLFLFFWEGSIWLLPACGRIICPMPLFDPGGSERFSENYGRVKCHPPLFPLDQAMPPHTRRVVYSPEPENPPSLPSPAVPPPQPAGRQASIVRDGESFDLDNISGSDEPEPGDQVPIVVVNDPDVIKHPPKSSADIIYFFDKSGEKIVCKICR